MSQNAESVPKCDRCGAEAVDWMGNADLGDYALCLDCWDSFMKWLAEGSQ